MAMLTWLPDVLEDAGLDVYVMPGALTRTTRASGLFVQGQVFHHTATSTVWQDGHVAALLRDGRRDLLGPLSQLGVERDGTVVVVACGRANHNGHGLWGNDSIGWEVYNDGVGEYFPVVQQEAVAIGMAAVASYLGHNPYKQIKAHRETDPKRKIDPRSDRIDMDQFRTWVWELMNGEEMKDEDWVRIQKMISDSQEEIIARIEQMQTGLARIPRRLTHGVLDGGPIVVADADEKFGEKLRGILD